MASLVGLVGLELGRRELGRWRSDGWHVLERAAARAAAFERQVRAGRATGQRRQAVRAPSQSGHIKSILFRKNLRAAGGVRTAGGGGGDSKDGSQHTHPCPEDRVLATKVRVTRQSECWSITRFRLPGH